MLQFIGVVLSAAVAFAVAKFNRQGAKEANQNTGWSSLVAALQKEIEALQKKQDSEDLKIKDLTYRVSQLESSRRRWKWWGRRVAEIMEERGIPCPAPPEPLEETDPNLQKR